MLDKNSDYSDINVNGKNNNDINNIDRIKYGIYNINGINDNDNKMQSIIVPMGFIELGKNETADKLIKRTKISQYIYTEVYKCGVIHTFLASNTKLPMMYLAVSYEKKALFKTILFSIFIYFTVEATKITNENQLINSVIDGKFSIELYLHNKVQILDNSIFSNGFIKNPETYLHDLVVINYDKVIYDLVKEKDIEYKQKYSDVFQNFDVDNMMSIINNVINKKNN